MRFFVTYEILAGLGIFTPNMHRRDARRSHVPVETPSQSPRLLGIMNHIILTKVFYDQICALKLYSIIYWENNQNCHAVKVYDLSYLVAVATYPIVNLKPSKYGIGEADGDTCNLQNYM